MAFEHQLRRLSPFEGLCLTAQDLVAEQLYHRRSLQRHSLFLHGFGIVQGLQVDLEQDKKRYIAVIKAGYGIAASGQGVQLLSDVKVPLEVPKTDGEYVLWMFHVESLEPETSRPVYDTNETRPSRVAESAAPRLLPADEDHVDGVALARITVRLGRMVLKVDTPVPRAGRRSRAAESYLKPRVIEFIRLSRKILANLFRTALLKELSVGAFGFYSALVAAEFTLIEEGTTDRVLYRTAGLLIAHAHDFYDPLPPTTDRINQFTEFVRRVNAEIPGVDQGDDTWLRWFNSFERLIQPLQRIADELEKTINAG